MATKVSIIMPSLNVAEYIDESIQSVLNQTLKDIEIICVDAGSTDGTIEKIESYIDDDRYRKRLSLLHSPVKSYGYQVNLGIRQAKGKYVGIVETDDYVDVSMYENLVRTAEKFNCDYVKADYDAYWTTMEGVRIYEKVSLYREHAPEYNISLNVAEHPELLCKDINVWKGIYSRQFLLDNHIWFNESAGAAFQDIGFLQQVYWYAEKAVILDTPFYKYCTDRDNSSTNKGNGLRFAYQEYTRLMHQDFCGLVEAKRLNTTYQHMADVFCWNLGQSIRKGKMEENREYIHWFITNLSLQLIEGNFQNKLLDGLLENKDRWLQNFIAKEIAKKEWNERFCNSLRDKEVVVFGSGNRGKSCYKLLDQNKIYVNGFCDNNHALWGEKIGLKEISSPADVIKTHSQSIFVIANKNYADEIRKQLLDYGIDNSKIVYYTPISN